MRCLTRYRAARGLALQLSGETRQDGLVDDLSRVWDRGRL